MKHLAMSFAAAQLLSVSALALVSSNSFAFPGWDRNLPPAPESADFASPYDYSGIVALSNCSGSLVRFDDSQDEDKALVLTNGHCTGTIEPGTVRYKESANRTFDLLNAAGGKLGKVTTNQLVYATMTKSDMALYALNETYAVIVKKFGIQALTVSRTQPAVETAIEVISGYWKRGYSCSIETISFGLQEGRWNFESSIRYSRPGCDVIGGTSGSPVIEAGTRTVVAINNSGNQDGLQCKVNNPCEIDADGGIIFKKGYSYAQQTYWLYSCRTEAGVLDFTLPGCVLPKPRV